jgi:hypothetical protein
MMIHSVNGQSVKARSAWRNPHVTAYLDLVVEARKRELEVRTLELSQRAQWYDLQTIDRLERELEAARGRMHAVTIRPAHAR